MHKRILAALPAAALLLAAAPGAASAADPAAAPGADVTVSLTAKAFHLSTTKVTHSGAVSFAVSTPTVPADETVGFLVFKPKKGYTSKQIAGWIRVVSGDGTTPAQAAATTRKLHAGATFYGGADVGKATPLTAWLTLTPGTYYAIDEASFSVRTLTISGAATHTAPKSTATATMVDGERFRLPSTLPKSGTLLVKNTSDDLHFLFLEGLKKGSTKAKLAAFLKLAAAGKNPGPPPLTGIAFGTDVLSPGQSQLLTYSAPAGPYGGFCWVPDETTGMPHALMGMWAFSPLK
ncbi:hypothetical protein EV189_2744 [Motilibacter rhizosphaerae]|uniref:Uncharacterized protein n=1 Tax=Motilibacter rhizosphaerae TaxID=598652 RepID=A0A4Q7NPW0_9ACTN|nr:hypothetical protein [Motilibacter rhizosphaerae]RZS87319.1 hypothetical protein EV189_2744 [Motilibacter rhizosphaerae]